MDGFRAIYHDDPQDLHAARAVEQVAELLAEQGRELDDRKSLRDAAGQYEFLAKAYPGGLAPGALGKALALLGPAGVDDVAEARRVRAELRAEYPRSAEAREVVRSGDRVATSPTSQKRDVGHPVTRSVVDAPVGMRLGDVMKAEERGGVASATTPARTVASVKPMAMVTGIRHWSTASYTRVAIDLGDDGEAVTYEAARVEHPDRIFFDIHHARVTPQLAGKSFAVTDDGFLTRIRAAQAGEDVTRVVLDVKDVGEYSAFLLPNPTRLIIDIHGEAGSRKQEVGSSVAAPIVRAVPAAASVIPPTSQNRDVGHPAVTETSSLPPMPVTDGSAGFGLGPRSSAATKTVAQPRVVISSRSTVSRPVPNSVTTNAVDGESAVAAVSGQPGKVEASRGPTSRPVVAKSVDTSGGDHYRKPLHIAGEPVAAPLPTADGETSMVRALGLKIGRIVIDAGHGGHDSGTLGAGGIQEKDVVLDVALRLGKLLHDRLGAEIVYTRADDTFIPLETRTAIANKAQADLFISVHANSSPDASARGVEVYYLNFTSDPDAMKVASRENAVSTQSVHELSDLVKKIALKDKIDESKELAADVDASLYSGLRRGNDGLKDRGVKKAPFVVLIGANMPSILAEISFVTNPDDAEQLETPAYRERVAESLYKGVERYASGVNGVKPKAAVERAARE
jgi:N-acetylmuramoyl-L-alanine amidase